MAVVAGAAGGGHEDEEPEERAHVDECGEGDHHRHQKVTQPLSSLVLHRRERERETECVQKLYRIQWREWERAQRLQRKHPL